MTVEDELWWQNKNDFHFQSVKAYNGNCKDFEFK